MLLESYYGITIALSVITAVIFLVSISFWIAEQEWKPALFVGSIFLFFMFLVSFPNIMKYDTIIELKTVIPVKVEGAYYIKLKDEIVNVNDKYGVDLLEDQKLTVKITTVKMKFFTDGVTEEVEFK